VIGSWVTKVRDTLAETGSGLGNQDRICRLGGVIVLGNRDGGPLRGGHSGAGNRCWCCRRRLPGGQLSGGMSNDGSTPLVTSEWSACRRAGRVGNCADGESRRVGCRETGGPASCTRLGVEETRHRAAWHGAHRAGDRRVSELRRPHPAGNCSVSVRERAATSKGVEASRSGQGA
jgi:hypothetical protein